MESSCGDLGQYVELVGTLSPVQQLQNGCMHDAQKMRLLEGQRVPASLAKRQSPLLSFQRSVYREMIHIERQASSQIFL